MEIKWVAFVLALGVFLFVIELIRREKLTFKYAFAWLIFSLLGVFSSLQPRIVYIFSVWLGFEVPSNFIFFSLLGCFVVLSLLLTVFLCQQSKRNERMAQKIALLETELNALKEKK